MLVYDAKCKSCSAPIRLVKGPGGGRIAIDARPTSKGDLVLSHGGQIAIKHDEKLHSGYPRYERHAANCSGGA